MEALSLGHEGHFTYEPGLFFSLLFFACPLLIISSIFSIYYIFCILWYLKKKILFFLFCCCVIGIIDLCWLSLEQPTHDRSRSSSHLPIGEGWPMPTSSRLACFHLACLTHSRPKSSSDHQGKQAVFRDHLRTWRVFLLPLAHTFELVSKHICPRSELQAPFSDVRIWKGDQ